MTKILVVSTYPIKKGQHGGQRRVAAIVEAYRKQGIDVCFVAVFAPDHYKYYSRQDIAVKGETRSKTLKSPYTSDIICGQAIYKDPYVKKKFQNLLIRYKPDIIEIEQVFPYLGLKPLLEEMRVKPKIILSSHNIEYSHKQQILNSSGYASEAEEAANLIKECEADLAHNASLIIAVSKEDAAVLSKMGSKGVVVAPNGIAQYPLTEEAKRHWIEYKKEHEISKLATFIGSAHPPNWHGFLAMIGDRVGFLPAASKLILAGSISDYFRDVFKDLRPEHSTFWTRIVPAGRINDKLLTGLIDQSDVLLLPITEGGGSNLKTAEAILSGKKIVATSYAFRSFEQYLMLPNIFIADTPADFRSAVLRAFQTAHIAQSAEQKQLAERVQWQYCLQPMIEAVKTI